PPYHRLDGNPEGSSPLVLARRRTAATTFACVHEPYDTRSRVRHTRRVQETDEAVGVALEGDTFSDRVLIAFYPEGEQTLGSAGESFTFRDHAHVRIADKGVTVRGLVTAFRLQAMNVEKVTLNGKEQAVHRDGNFIVFGEPKAVLRRGDDLDDEQERAASVQY